MENAPFSSVERTVLMRVRERLRPELLGRISEIIVFARLPYPVQRQICEDLIATECARLAGLGHRSEVSPDAVEFMVRQGYHRMLGARPMRAVVERLLQEAVTRNLLAGKCAYGQLTAESATDRLRITDLMS